MCIVTDGLPDDKASALEVAEGAKNDGIDIMAIGVDFADKGFLQAVASRDDLAQPTTAESLERKMVAITRMLPDKEK